MTRTLPSYTSSNNAYAYAFYAGEAVLGALILFWNKTVDSLATLLFVPFAGLVMFAAGVLGVIAVTLAHKRPTPDRGVALEAHAAIGLFVVNAIFFVALTLFYEPDQATLAKVFTMIFWAGGLARWLQIRHDRRRFRRALATTTLSHATHAEHDTTND